MRIVLYSKGIHTIQYAVGFMKTLAGSHVWDKQKWKRLEVGGWWNNQMCGELEEWNKKGGRN